jgi:hypothetical protein
LSGGAAVAADHSGYTGSGFVGGLTKPGAAIVWQASEVPSAGQYAVQFRYANATGGDGKDETRTMTLTDAEGAGTGNGTPLIIYTCRARTNQAWKSPAGASSIHRQETYPWIDGSFS